MPADQAVFLQNVLPELTGKSKRLQRFHQGLDCDRVPRENAGQTFQLLPHRGIPDLRAEGLAVPLQGTAQRYLRQRNPRPDSGFVNPQENRLLPRFKGQWSLSGCFHFPRPLSFKELSKPPLWMMPSMNSGKGAA